MAAQFLFWEYLFQIFCIVSLQCAGEDIQAMRSSQKRPLNYPDVALYMCTVQYQLMEAGMRRVAAWVTVKQVSSVRACNRHVICE